MVARNEFLPGLAAEGFNWQLRHFSSLAQLAIEPGQVVTGVSHLRDLTAFERRICRQITPMDVCPDEDSFIRLLRYNAIGIKPLPAYTCPQTIPIDTPINAFAVVFPFDPARVRTGTRRFMGAIEPPLPSDQGLTCIIIGEEPPPASENTFFHEVSYLFADKAPSRRLGGRTAALTEVIPMRDSWTVSPSDFARDMAHFVLENIYKPKETGP